MKGIFQRALIRVRNLFIDASQVRKLPRRARSFALWLGLRVSPMFGGATSANSQHGSLATLHFWDVSLSPDAWTKFGQVRRFGVLGVDRPEVDVTDLDSTGVERIGGLADGREITIEIYANTTTMPQIESLFSANATIDLKATFPAPLSLTRYFSIAPLGIDQPGQVEPNTPLMVSLRGRISGSISSTPSHP